MQAERTWAERLQRIAKKLGYHCRLDASIASVKIWPDATGIAAAVLDGVSPEDARRPYIVTIKSCNIAVLSTDERDWSPVFRELDR
jgi:hypothetical protein